MPILLYELLCIKKEKGDVAPHEVSLGFVAEQDLQVAEKYCQHQNALAMYNEGNDGFPTNYRLRPAVHPSLQFVDEVVIVDIYDDDTPAKIRTIPRSQALKEHGDGATGVLFPHFYREILPIVDGETQEQWTARREGSIARGKAILKMRAETQAAIAAINKQ